MAEIITNEIIVVTQLTQKQGKTGRLYHVGETDKGPFTIFEGLVVDKIAANLGKKLDVEVATSEKGFKNIRKINQVLEGIPAAPVMPNPLPKAIATETANDYIKSRDSMMMISYAKDIFCELIKSNPGNANRDAYFYLMNLSIELIGQARKSL